MILYKHALLGEGIATYLRRQIDVDATVASAHDPDAARSALALNPAVVIFESTGPFQQFDLATLAPHAVLIDVSTVITRGSVVSPGVAGLEQILQAVRDCSIIAGPLETGSALAGPLGTSPLAGPLETSGPIEGRRNSCPETAGRLETCPETAGPLESCPVPAGMYPKSTVRRMGSAEQ